MPTMRVDIEKLKAEILRLDASAKTVRDAVIRKTDFDSARANVARGKCIAYGHVLTLIEDQLKK